MGNTSAVGFACLRNKGSGDDIGQALNTASVRMDAVREHLVAITGIE